MKTRELLTYLGEILNDEGLEFWTRAFLLRILNEARTRLPFVLPFMTAQLMVVEVLDTPDGLQLLPVDLSLGLIRVEGLLLADGNVLPLGEQSEAGLDVLDRRWKMMRDSGCCAYWVKHPQERRGFWLYQRVEAGQKVLVLHTALSPLLTDAEDSVFAFRPEYETNVVDFVLARAYEREGTQSDKVTFYMQRALGEVNTSLALAAGRKGDAA